jgi:G3E family GTPase
MRRDGARPTIPVTLLTGFLGSGKTTLLNALLADPAMRRTAVVVNEFGSIAIDHDLVHAGREDFVVTSTGCICCAAGSDIRTSLYEVAEAADRGAFPAFERVVVETTGLADPAPIINSLIPGGVPALGLGDHVVARRFHLAGVVTTFDALLGELALERHVECWKQLAFADRIVLTKTDLVRDPTSRRELSLRRQRLAALNASASILAREESPGPAILLRDGSYTPSDRPEDVLGWLALDRAMAGGGHVHAAEADRHGDRILALPFVATEPLDPGYFDAFLDLMMLQAGVLRLKGLVALADDPGRPLLVHGVQHVLHEKRRLAAWPGQDRRSRIVVLGEGISPDAAGRLFAAAVRRPLVRRLAGAFR